MLDQRGAAAQGYAVGQDDGGFEAAEHQEPAQRDSYLLSVLRDAGGEEQRNVFLPGTVVGVQATPAVDVGIDRYLERLAGSTFPADQVNDGAAAFLPDELSGFRGYFQVSGHIVISPGVAHLKARWGQGGDVGYCRAARNEIHRRYSS